jgi:hypothetical protein
VIFDVSAFLPLQGQAVQEKNLLGLLDPEGEGITILRNVENH